MTRESPTKLRDRINASRPATVVSVEYDIYSTEART
jgi:hypothetical protein